MNEPHQATVLVVDDDPKSLQLLGSLLRSQDFDVVYADDGKEALKAIQSLRPDVVVLDIMMPEMDGYEVCCRLKENSDTAEIPVIFLTAKTQPEDVVSGFFAGGADYVTKPFNPVELLVRIETQVELKRSQREARQLTEDLTKLVKNQKQFFSILAHDLRSQVSGCLGLMDLTLEDFDKYEKPQFYDHSFTVKTELEKTFDFLNNLLDWGRMLMNQKVFTPKVFELSEYAVKIVDMLNTHAGRKSIKLQNQIPDRMKAFGDPDTIAAVLRNLIYNAIKFTPQGGSVTVRAVEKDKGVEVSVQDTGVGMSAEFAQNLFQMDKKVTTLGTNNESGFGFGLLLCHDLLAKQNGKIWVESAEGKGSTFHFYLPPKSA